jgi:hypothetical protein
MLLCALVLASESGGSAIVAQNAATTTLHVYTDLMQIPVLVLGPNRERLSPIASKKFMVSLDSGPWFRATHVRPEGDDPISLSILLDLSGPDTELMPKIDEAIARLAPVSLRPQDHVSIYILDCSLVRLLHDAPAEQELLLKAVDRALQPWNSRGRHSETGCQQPAHLWDSVAFLANELHGLPGRRVVMAVTDGQDKGSKHTWNQVRGFAQYAAVAIFGLTYVPNEPGRTHFVSREGIPFNSVCELSGGIVLTASERDVDRVLKKFMQMLRERYIVELPRPSNGTKGVHSLDMKIDKTSAMIRTTGISVPVRDPTLMADPATIPSDPSLAPELGTRRVLTPPQ